MKYEKQIADLYKEAKEIKLYTRGVKTSYLVELFREELAKPQYAKISIPTKHKMLRILLDVTEE